MAVSHTDPQPISAAVTTRRRLVTTGCMIAIFMAAVEVSIVATAMPTIVAELGGARFFSWVFAAYLLTQAVSTPIYGRLADIHGRKPVFVAGATLFLAGSLACGFTWNMVSLVVFRIIQGLGAGSIQAVTTTIVGDIYGGPQRARVQGWMSMVWAIAAIIGPMLGAFIVAHLSWAYVFWINLPIGAVAIALIAAFLDEKLERRAHQIDYLGSALLMLGLGAIMTVLVQAHSLDAPVAAALTALGLAALAWLVVQERRAAEPVIPIALLRNPVIATGNLGSLMIGAVLMCVVGFLPTHVQAVMGRSAATAGVLVTTLSVAWSVGSIAAGRLMPRTSYRAAGAAGALFLIAGAALLIMLAPHQHDQAGLATLTAGALLIGIGMGACNIAFLLVVQGSVGWNERGVATASTLFTRTIGQTIGAGLAGAILNLGIARHAGGAHDALDQLLEASARGSVDTPQLARLVDAAARSLHDVYVVAGVLAAVTLATALMLPKGLRPAEAK